MKRQNKFLNTTEVAMLLHRANRTIQHWGQQWENMARASEDPLLPSSPANGLRRSGACAGRALYEQRDVNEYVDNAVREALGQSLQNWRKESSHEFN